MILSTPEQNLSSLDQTKDILSKVSEYFRQLNHDSKISTDISEELQQLSYSKNKSVPDLLAQSVPFCDKIEKLILLSHEIKNNSFRINLNLDVKIRFLKLTYEIIDEYWNIIPEVNQNEIRTSLESISSKTGKQIISSYFKNPSRLLALFFSLFHSFKDKGKSSAEINYYILRLSDSIRYKVGLLDFIFPGDKFLKSLLRKFYSGRFNARPSLRSLVRDVALEYNLGKSPEQIAKNNSLNLSLVHDLLLWYSTFREETDLEVFELSQKYNLLILNSTQASISSDHIGIKHFSGLRIGNTLEEQLRLNQPAMDLLKAWIDKSPSSDDASIEIMNDEFRDFQEIIDNNRPVGRNVFS
jgi:hypothetical protein